MNVKIRNLLKNKVFTTLFHSEIGLGIIYRRYEPGYELFLRVLIIKLIFIEIRFLWKFMTTDDFISFRKARNEN